MDSIYIGGSQSINNTFKYPSKNSDVDVYVISSAFTLPWNQNDGASIFATKSLGHNIQVFEISLPYKDEVIKGMELI